MHDEHGARPWSHLLLPGSPLNLIPWVLDIVSFHTFNVFTLMARVLSPLSCIVLSSQSEFNECDATES